MRNARGLSEHSFHPPRFRIGDKASPSGPNAPMFAGSIFFCFFVRFPPFTSEDIHTLMDILKCECHLF